MSANWGDLLSLCREMKELSLRDVEKLTDISASQLSKIERGESCPGFLRVLALCDLYGLPIERLAKKARKNGRKS